MLNDGTGKRPWVFVAHVDGLFSRIHRVTGPLLIAFLIAVPWITIEGRALFRIDLPHRELHLLGSLFTATDTKLLLVLGLSAAVGLGVFTALVGRVWCGYLCPQTVFLEEWVRQIEEMIEGNRGARRRLDEAPWGASKVLRKSLKWFIFLLHSVVLGMTLVSYFGDARELWLGEAGSVAYTFVAALSLLFYLDFVWFREQFCNYLCPYARIQSVLTDQNTWTVGYDAKRGEPRHLKGVSELPFGDCIDCNLCVNVCPQGIDIRNGFQLECITCGHCIDACTSVMEKQDLPSLINYTTEARLNGAPPERRIRPWIYSAILVALLGIFVTLVLTHELIDGSVTRQPGPMFIEMDGGLIRNSFQAHIENRSNVPRTFHLSVEGLNSADVMTAAEDLVVPAGGEVIVPVFVTLDRKDAPQRTTKFHFVLVSGEDVIRRNGTFKSPGSP